MKYQNIDHWSDPSADRGLVYFAQRFDELTWNYTLDSYRAPTTTPPSLVSECLKGLKLSKELGKSAKSVEHIIDELKLRIKGNPMAHDCMSLSVERYFGFKIEEADKAKSLLTILQRELSPAAYFCACASRLQRTIASNNKSQIDQLALELASTLLNYGFNPQHLNEVCHDIFFDASKEVALSTSIPEFLNCISPINKKFSIFIDANSKVRELNAEISKGFGVRELRKYPKKVLDLSKDTPLPNSKGRIVQFEKIVALDKYSALEMAMSRLKWVHDIYGLFRHRNTIDIGGEALILEIDSDRLTKLRTDTNQMHRISDNKPQQANKKLNEMLETLRLPNGPDKARFFRVINFHGLSARSESQENQLINLWTAFETLTSNHHNSASIVDNVIREVVPIIGLNYYYRLTRSAMLDVHRWDRTEFTNALRNAEKLNDKDLIHKFYSIAGSPENDDAKEGLLGSITNFELLRYRIFSINKFLKSGRKLHEKLLAHEKLVAWQLHRIYRARNQIIHSSTTNFGIDSLIVSAHDYFDQVFDLTATLCSGDSGFLTYEEAFCFCREQYIEYKRSILKITDMKTEDIDKVLWQPKEPLSIAKSFGNAND